MGMLRLLLEDLPLAVDLLDIFLELLLFGNQLLLVGGSLGSPTFGHSSVADCFLFAHDLVLHSLMLGLYRFALSFTGSLDLQSTFLLELFNHLLLHEELLVALLLIPLVLLSLFLLFKVL